MSRPHVLEPWADPAVLRSQGRETEARRAERYREDCRTTAKALDRILGLAERDRDSTFRSAMLWLESQRTDGYSERDRNMATILHVALLVGGFPADREAFAWVVEIARNSQWPRERTLALELVERIVEAGEELVGGIDAD